MKVLGLNGTKVIVELSCWEWHSIGGRLVRNSYGSGTVPDIEASPPNIGKLVESLKAIKDASPDLERIRASFKTFLMLTEPEAITEVLKQCGVAEPVVEDDESDVEEPVEA